MARQTDTLETNYLADFKSYPATSVFGDGVQYWIGLKADADSGKVLDCKWWLPDLSSEMVVHFHEFSWRVVGQQAENINNPMDAL